VSAVVQNTIAVPVPHHYTLLAVAQAYHSEGRQRSSVQSALPGAAERSHSRRAAARNVDPARQLHADQRTIEETTTRKLTALQQVVERLERDLPGYPGPGAAPPLRRSSPHLAGLPPQSVLWYEYTRLNLALQELETVEIRAMPAHERVARYKSAQLTIRLEGAAKQEAYHSLQEAAPQSLPPRRSCYLSIKCGLGGVQHSSAHLGLCAGAAEQPGLPGAGSFSAAERPRSQRRRAAQRDGRRSRTDRGHSGRD